MDKIKMGDTIYVKGVGVGKIVGLEQFSPDGKKSFVVPFDEVEVERLNARAALEILRDREWPFDDTVAWLFLSDLRNAVQVEA